MAVKVSLDIRSLAPIFDRCSTLLLRLLLSMATVLLTATMFIRWLLLLIMGVETRRHPPKVQVMLFLLRWVETAWKSLLVTLCRWVVCRDDSSWFSAIQLTGRWCGLIRTIRQNRLGS